MELFQSCQSSPILIYKFENENIYCASGWRVEKHQKELVPPIF